MSQGNDLNEFTFISETDFASLLSRSYRNFNDQTGMLKDKFDRIHDYLRISLTDKCNLRCTYCFPAGSQASIAPRSNQMTPEEIENIAGVFVSQGVKKIRLTGGEPLIRKDAVEIIERLSKFPVELTITTNGVFVDEFIGV